MASSPPVEPDEQTVSRRKSSDQAASAICASVMRALGRPKYLHRVSAVRLWGNQYRVNVQTGIDAVSIRIAHSFFITADEDGAVLQSVPPVVRCY